MSGRPPRYLLASGEECPGVTTVLGDEVDSLLFWSNGLARKPAIKMLEALRKLTDEWDDYDATQLDHKVVGERARTAGTKAHDMIESYLRSRVELATLTMDEAGGILLEARNAYDNFLRWWRSCEISPMEIERVMVSEKMRVGGTCDLIGTVRGKNVVVDWKTASTPRLYPKAVLQIAAYGMMREELWAAEGKAQRVDEYHLVCFARSSAKRKPMHKSWSRREMERAGVFSGFKARVRAHRAMAGARGLLIGR